MIEKTRTDATGRKYQEWYGSPKAWMQTWMAPGKKLVGIRQSNVTGWIPPAQSYKE
jgi:hypothetical protein